MTFQPTIYPQSYVEKERIVRNSTAVKVPGVDILRDFTLSKSDFEATFLQKAKNMDDLNRLPSPGGPAGSSAQLPPAPAEPSRLKRTRKSNARRLYADPLSSSTAVNAQAPSSTTRRVTDTDLETARRDPATAASTSSSFSDELHTPHGHPCRQPPSKLPQALIATSCDAADYSDVHRQHVASLQRSAPPNYDGKRQFFQKACNACTKHGFFCSPENADAHVEYARNICKRGLTPAAEYHLRSAADIYRMLNARMVRKHGDVLPYLAVVIDRRGHLAEAEHFYSSALVVYRANKLSDDNVRVASDSLNSNFCTQGCADEVDVIVRRHFLGFLD